MVNIEARLEGSSWPLGVSWVPEEATYNFAIYAKDAKEIALFLYDAQDFVAPVAVIPFDVRRNKTGRVWHNRVSLEVTSTAAYYAYRIDGTNAPQSGARYDPQKILLDPYARGVFFPPGHSRTAACLPGSNAGCARWGYCLGIISRPVIKRLVRLGMAMNLSFMKCTFAASRARPIRGVPDDQRGTYAGVIAKIPYLLDLGITAVELMPVQQFDPDEENYWGYNTLNFFSPHAQYCSNAQRGGPLEEFRAMVEGLHKAGIEVFLDVVYNHTTEEGRGGPTYCYRGIDNTTYYALSPEDMSIYINHSQCGNDLRTSHPVVRQLIIDSLRYWVRETNVDGFRFDLASIFAFAEDGKLNLNDPPIISEITNDPTLAHVKLIAEPWAADGECVRDGPCVPGQVVASME